MRNPLPFIILISSLVCVTEAAVARTWYVAADGSGDAPTIMAAVDSTVSGDAILVGPGTHLVPSLLLKAQTSLESVAGPTQTTLQPAQSPQFGMVGLNDGCRLSGFWIAGGYSFSVNVRGHAVEVSFNIIEGAPGSYGVQLNGRAVIHHNLCFGGFAGITLVTFNSETQINNNIILNGIYSGNTDCPPLIWADCNLINGDQSCVLGSRNFSGDPLFCGSGNYYLREDSPCASGNHPDGIDCGSIGPLPVGCRTVKVEHKTWGQVKALYRN
jgi:hypothetical protein